MAGSEFCSDRCAEAYAEWELAQEEWDETSGVVTDPDHPDTSSAPVSFVIPRRINHSPSTALRRPNSAARSVPM